ncbi:MAG: FAD-dependent oxidoreductase, partial [Tepidisphaeraceae bacterium]
RLDRPALLASFPQFRIADDAVGVLEPHAGFLLPELAVRTFVMLAGLAGAMIHQEEPVRRWRTESSHVEVETDRTTYSAQHVVFCGGAWSAKLLRDLGVKLVVTRQVMGWVTPAEPGSFLLGMMPVWGMEAPDGSLYYGFPLRSEEPGLKVAHHVRGPVTDPDTDDRVPTAADDQSIRRIASHCLHAASGPTAAMKVCFYTNSPDSHFIIDLHPAHPRASFASGFSGHGFKFASVVGEVMADLAMHGRSELPIGFLRLGRGFN